MKFLKLFQGESKDKENAKEPMTQDQYLAEAHRIFQVSWDILHNTNWRLEKHMENGDTVHSAHLPVVGKVFKAQGIVNMEPRALLNLMFCQPDQFSKWNPVIVESRLLQNIDENTHISYQVTAERVGGLVARRDFVILSHWAMRDNCYVLAGASVPHPAAPHHNRYVRGENGPSCWIMRPVKESKSRCQLEWYLDTNLRGWLPQYVVDAAFSSIMLDNLNNVRAYAKKQNEQASSQSN
ncbi:stAR-related lipid transfer protein 3 [Anabrus simplex]|uniref:stAR-related lipid transfer protein 3 n=1 Tax=Anabrus simplex TaxID=316456 RepID=UPI0035A2EBD9